VTIVGASSGKGGACFFAAISGKGGNVNASTAASAIHKPMTTSGHRATKSPSRWKIPHAATSVVPLRRNTRRLYTIQPTIRAVTCAFRVAAGGSAGWRFKTLVPVLARLSRVAGHNPSGSGSPVLAGQKSVAVIRRLPK
jgi:hypothetical protein